MAQGRQHEGNRIICHRLRITVFRHRDSNASFFSLRGINVVNSHTVSGYNFQFVSLIQHPFTDNIRAKYNRIHAGNLVHHFFLAHNMMIAVIKQLPA